MKIDKDIPEKLKKALRKAKSEQKTANRERLHFARVREELEQYHEFSEEINSCKTAEEILRKGMSLLRKRFHIETSFLTMLDREKSELYVYTSGPIPKHFTPEMVDYVNQIRIPLNRQSGLVYTMIQTKTSFLYRAR